MAATNKKWTGPPDCEHKDRPHFAKGLCQQCYMREYDKKRHAERKLVGPRRRPGLPPRSADCHPDRPHHAKGLCKPCYYDGYESSRPADCHPDKPHLADGLCVTCYSKRKYELDPEAARRLARESHARMSKRNREEMLEAYGGKCACPKCPETNPAFLTLEHINGDGAAHRKAVGRGHTIADLRRRGWPKDGYTLLCWNCNCATRGGKTCPHMEGDLMAGRLTVTAATKVSGPLFDGNPGGILDRYAADVRQTIAQRGVDKLRAFPMDKTGRARGGFQENLNITPRGADTLAIFGPMIKGVTWAPWLEGSSKRNNSTSFKGYHLFTKTRLELDRQAGQIAEDVLKKYMPELGGA